jgi:hypothetical protein
VAPSEDEGPVAHLGAKRLHAPLGERVGLG